MCRQELSDLTVRIHLYFVSFVLRLRPFLCTLSFRRIEFSRIGIQEVIRLYLACFALIEESITSSPLFRRVSHRRIHKKWRLNEKRLRRDLILLAVLVLISCPAYCFRTKQCYFEREKRQKWTVSSLTLARFLSLVVGLGPSAPRKAREKS